MTNLLHVRVPGGLADQYEDLWATPEVGTDLVLDPGAARSARELVEVFTHLIKKHRPRVLVTHWDEAIRPAAWAAYRNRVPLVCHRYEATPLALDRATRSAFSLVRGFVVPGESHLGALSPFRVKASVVPCCPRRDRGLDLPEDPAVGLWDHHRLAVGSFRRHMERHYPDVRVYAGPDPVSGAHPAPSLEDLLGSVRVVMDRTRTLYAKRYLVDARVWGRVVVAPDTAMNKEALGEGAVYYGRNGVFGALKQALEMTPPPYSGPSRADALAALADAYRRAA